MWRRRPISRKASRSTFLGAWSLQHLVIEIYNAKQSSDDMKHRQERAVGPRNTFQPSKRWLELGGFEFHRCLRHTNSPVTALRRRRHRRHHRLCPDCDYIHRGEKEVQKGGLKGHSKRRKLSSKAKSRCWQLKEREESFQRHTMVVQSVG